MKWSKYFVADRAFEISTWVFENLEIWDSHTHIGFDKDEMNMSLKDLLKNMKKYNIKKSILFPLNDTRDQTFNIANDEIYAAYKKHPKKFIHFFRLNPHSKWKDEFNLRVEQGFRGIKLHPRTQNFDLDSASAMQIYEKAEEKNLPILIHTDRGLNEIGDKIEAVIKEYPKLKLILGHAAFVDMDHTIRKLSRSKNIYFETSAIAVFDIFDILQKVEPYSIVYGSDIPYVDMEYSLESIIHIADAVNISMKNLQKMLSGNLRKWFDD